MDAIRALLCILLPVAMPAFAQDARWELVDPGILNHSSCGEGIDMRIKPDPVPDGLFGGNDFDNLMLALCNHYAPTVIPYVIEQSGIEAPEFIAV